MSRSGYEDGGIDDLWGWIRWRGAVASGLRGKRGKALLVDLRSALDAMSEKTLIVGKLEADGEYCALGAVAHLRGVPTEPIEFSDADAEHWNIDSEAESRRVAEALDISNALACEIMYLNDEGTAFSAPEHAGYHRWKTVSEWVDRCLAANP